MKEADMQNKKLILRHKLDASPLLEVVCNSVSSNSKFGS